MPLLVKDGDKTFKSPDGKLFTTNDGYSFTSKTTGTNAGSDGKILAIDNVVYRFNDCNSSAGKRMALNLIAVILAALLILINWFIIN